MSRIDLHIHTTASDGTRSPSEIVRMASAIGLSALSITDHDTMDGIEDAQETARELEVRFIPGVELSVDIDDAGMTAHLLGYFPGCPGRDLVDPDTPLGQAIDYVKGGRSRRNPRILKELSRAGVRIDMDEVEKLADGGVVGRPHIAQAMLNEGYVSTMQEAFGRYLARGRCAYVERDRLPVRRAIELIRGAGGLPVMAHPGYIPLDTGELEGFFRRMTDFGLAGIEAVYPTHTAKITDLLRSLAAAFGLVITGGTDYHGRNNEAAPLGGSPAGFRVTEEDAAEFLKICSELTGR